MVARLDDRNGRFARMLTQWQNHLIRKRHSPDGEPMSQLLVLWGMNPVSEPYLRQHTGIS